MSSIASLTRREFLAGSAAVVALTRNVHAQAAAGPFKLEPLPYPNNALEPHIVPWRSITIAITPLTS